MTDDTATYVLRFGDDTRTEMLVQLRPSETVRQNLSRIIPKAVSQGFLPATCSAENLDLELKGKTLSLDLPLTEQGVREYDMLVLQPLPEALELRLRIMPDKSDVIVESVRVTPNQIVGDAIGGLVNSLRQGHRFYGRKLKKFDLLLGKQKINLAKSLRAQDIKRDIEVAFRPRVWFEWPPRLIWPPGPYTTYALVLGGVGLVLCLAFLRGYFWKEGFYVRIVCDEPCRIYQVAEGAPALLGDDAAGVWLGPGSYRFRILPKNLPIVDTTITVAARFALTDTSNCLVRQAHLAQSAEKVPITVTAYRPTYKEGRPRPEAKIGKAIKNAKIVFVNEYPCSTDADGALKRDLVVGRYKIVYDIPVEKLVGIEFGSGYRDKGDPGDFIFDLADTSFLGKNNLTFFYNYEG